MSKFENIIHPTNRVWPGTPNNIMQTAEEAYVDGYIRGREWPDDWQYIPGGPWVGSKDSKFVALYNHEKLVHKEYMRGWHNGFAQAHETNMPGWYRYSHSNWM